MLNTLSYFAGYAYSQLTLLHPLCLRVRVNYADGQTLALLRNAACNDALVADTLVAALQLHYENVVKKELEKAEAKKTSS